MRWIFLCLLVMQAASCGQKGPLTLPDSHLAVTTYGTIVEQACRHCAQPT